MKRSSVLAAALLLAPLVMATFGEARSLKSSSPSSDLRANSSAASAAHAGFDYSEVR